MVSITTFEYTKADGSVSERIIVPMITPSKFLAGIDISEVDEETQALYAAEVAEIKEEYLKKLKLLETKYDLCNRYRQFSADRITNQRTEQI